MGPRGELWKKHHSQRRFLLGMKPGEKPWTSKRPRRKLRGIQGGLKSTSKRVLDLIDLGFGAYTRHREEMELPLEDKPGWFLEVGQSAERAPWGASLPLCSQKVRIYHYGMDQVLSSRQLSACHGYPFNMVDADLEEGQLQSLLGNGVFLPHLTICVLACFLEESAPWHRAEVQARAGEAQAAPAAATPAAPTPSTGPPSARTSAKKHVRFNF
jgi:hypothetical protein